MPPAPPPAPPTWGQQPPPGQAGPPGPAARERPPSAWLVVLPIALAVVLLTLVTVGLRTAGARSRPSGKAVEVPARADTVPTTTPGAAGPGTSIPAATLDTITPKVRESDADGRFEITVPRSWMRLPASLPDTMAWQLYEQDAGKEPVRTDFQFVLGWFESGGCDLDRCAARQADSLASGQPGVVIPVTPATVGAGPARRLEVDVGPKRVVEWIVVQGDRYWVMELIGPRDGLEPVLARVEPVLATMSFG